MDIRLFGILFVVVLSTGCEPVPTQRSKVDIERERERAILSDIAPDWKSRKARDPEAEARSCARNLRTDDAIRRAKADAARGEWRFLTYRHLQIGVSDEPVGIERCESSKPTGHDRLKQISSCGELGALNESDCACKDAEMAYRSAYNREIARRVSGARNRNCLPPRTDGMIPIYDRIPE